MLDRDRGVLRDVIYYTAFALLHFSTVHTLQVSIKTKSNTFC